MSRRDNRIRRLFILLLFFFAAPVFLYAQKKNWKIAYVLWRDTLTSENSIHIMDLDGKNDRVVIDYPGSNWMPLARETTIWFHLDKDTAGKKRGLYRYEIRKKEETWLLEARGLYQDIDTDPATRLYAGGFSHRPEGSSKSQYDIFLFNADGSFRKQLTRDTAIDLEPVFLPGTNQVIFRSNRDRNPRSWGEFEIYSIQTDGTGLKRLTFNPDTTANVLRASSPIITPSGKIVYTAYWEGTYRLMQMEPDGADLRPLLKMDDMEQTSCSFSPDGKQIVFTGRIKGMRNNDIYLVNADGSGLRRLTNDWRRKVQPFFIKVK